MNSTLKNIFVWLVFLSLVACNRNTDGSISWQPNNLNLTPPPGTPEYEQGWSDGCESGANAYSNTVYKTFKAFEFKYDATLRNNKVYHQVWKDAFVYCSLVWERSLNQNI